MIHRLHVVVEGDVQGVGFRYSTLAQAQARALAGWVRNLPDGRVEAEFEGAQADLVSVLEWGRQGPRSATVTHVDAAWETGAPRHRGFRIVF